MSAMRSEVYEAFQDNGAAEDEAVQAAATILGKRGGDLAKAVTDIRLDIAGVEGERIVPRWMLGCVLAADVAVIFELFSH